MITIISAIFVLLIPSTWGRSSEVVESVVLQDLLSHPNEIVNVKHSNSAGCKDVCSVKNYLATHFNSIANEIEKIKKTPKKAYAKTFGASVTENTGYQTKIEGHCSPKRLAPLHEEALAQAKIKLPPQDKLIACKLSIGFSFGENVWSEELAYLKHADGQAVLRGTFWAYGTP